MPVAGVTVVKDEIDIIGHVIGHMLKQVDIVIVADNQSTDGTREFLDSIPEVYVVDDPEVGHYQARKITGLAQSAAGFGATWVVPFDADELWFSRVGRLADALEALPAEILLAQATLYDHAATDIDRPVHDPVARMAWRYMSPSPFRKVAARLRPTLRIEQGNHSASYSDVAYAPAALDLIAVHHYPYRSAAQFVTKARNGAAAYAATSLPEGMGAHKRAYGRLLDEQGEDALRAVFYDQFYFTDPLANGLTHDPQ